MILRRGSNNGKVKVRFATALILVAFLFNSFGFAFSSTSVYAEPPDQGQTSTEEDTQNENPNDGEEAEEQNQEQEQVPADGKKTDDCKDSLGALGWLVCPFTGAIASATDFLYNKIITFLQIDPISNEEDSAILRAWEYARFFTNAVFIIFFLVLIYSQVTGFGISNYGIKKALPKIFVVAILINLSFLICVLAIDVSNILGNGIRGLFSSIEEGILNSTEVAVNDGVSLSGIYTAIVGGASLSVAGVAIAVESGAIWMLIPMALGALVSVASGLLTLGLRQAVVTLLVMISPLAFVAYMLPNTEKWFAKWKNLLLQMLIFFPMFSLLIGASHLAGFAILIASKDFLGTILGVAVQILPLFFSVKLMKMSDTFLGAVSTKIQGLTAAPLAVNRAWADSHRQLARQKTLASGFTPSARLVQFLSDRKVAREEEIGELAGYSKLRGQAYGVRRNYDSNGVPTAEGEAAYKRQALSMKYTLDMERHKNNMNKGLGGLETVKMNAGVIKRARLEALDVENVVASDKLKMEASRGAKIEYDNTVGYYERVKKAMYANADDEAIRSGKRKEHEFHGVLQDSANLNRFKEMAETMEGNINDTSFIVADAAHTFGAQSSIVKGKFGDHFKYIEATQDIVNEMNRMTSNKDAAKYIDPIVAGLRTLNMRGDTDLVERQIKSLLPKEGFEIGSHALQEISSFCMFDVKGSDPTLRRFGKYINLQTAQMFNEDNKNRRTKRDVSFKEYIDGGYYVRNDDGTIVYEEDGITPKFRKTKGADILLKGTSFKDMERTAMKTLTRMILDSATEEMGVDAEGKPIKSFDLEKFQRNEDKIWNAIMPNIIGDQFSFLSGSEQITALSKAITGTDGAKHKFDFEGIFGDLADLLTPKQKEDYMRHVHEERTKKGFLAGHVPVQIARTKTDMLEAIQSQYTLLDAIKDDPDAYRKLMDEEGLENAGGDEWKKKYEEYENKYLESVKEEFQKSFKKGALSSFKKMHKKGFQGEAKDRLIRLLDIKDDGDIDNEDNDEGMPVGSESGDYEGAIYEPYSITKSEMERCFNSYSMGDWTKIGSFWNEIKSILLSSNDISGAAGGIDAIESGLTGPDGKGVYTDVSQLWREIKRVFFGETD